MNEKERSFANRDLAIRFEDIFRGLLSGRKLDQQEKTISELFEFIATRLLGALPLRKGHYFDGAVGLTITVKTVRQLEIRGEMWVGGNQKQWTEPFQATVTDKGITEEGIWIVLQVGADQAQGELRSICCGTRG